MEQWFNSLKKCKNGFILGISDFATMVGKDTQYWEKGDKKQKMVSFCKCPTEKGGGHRKGKIWVRGGGGKQLGLLEMKGEGNERQTFKGQLVRQRRTDRRDSEVVGWSRKNGDEITHQGLSLNKKRLDKRSVRFSWGHKPSSRKG